MADSGSDTEIIISEARDASPSLAGRVHQMHREDSSYYSYPTRKQQKQYGWWRCHVVSTFLLALTVLLMATAVAYNPFRPEWRETVAVAKIMAPVGAGSRCYSPCQFFTARYPSPVEAFFLNREAPSAFCPLLDAKTANLARMQGAAVGAADVEVFFACPTDMPFNIIGTNTTRRAVNVHPVLLGGMFSDLRLNGVHLAYVGLPALMAKGVAVDEALHTVLSVAKTTKEIVRFPQVSSVDLVEAAAVQLLCAVDADEADIAVGMGCNTTARHW
jgi:hypothetical protein